MISRGLILSFYSGLSDNKRSLVMIDISEIGDRRFVLSRTLLFQRHKSLEMSFVLLYREGVFIPPHLYKI